jgi:small subunit ribosomal protein S19
MARSVWKGPFVDGYLLKKAEKRVRPAVARSDQDLEPPLHDPAAVRGPDLRRLQRPEACSRSSVNEDMVGHKFGEFAPTRTFTATGGQEGEEEVRAWASPKARALGQRGEGGCAHAPRQPAEAEPGRAADPRQEGRDRARRPRVLAQAHRRRTSRRRWSRDRQRREQPRPRRRRAVVAEAYVGKAIVMKRFHARGRGRAGASRSRSRT